MSTGRSGDQKQHPKEVERLAAVALEHSLEAQAARREYRMTLWYTAGSTLLGVVALYPIIRGTRTDNTVMMVVGFVIGLIAFKILPVDKLAGILSAWRGKGS